MLNIKRYSIGRVLLSLLITAALLPAGICYGKSPVPPKNVPTKDGTVISSTNIDIDKDRKLETVQIIMVKGRFYNDTELWAGNGEKWEGSFVVQTTKGKRVLSRQSLNRLMLPFDHKADDIFFWAPKFKLVFKDYNGDGLVDFNLGLYGSSNGNVYHLFTVKRDGVISPLPIADGSDGFFVSGAPRENSTRLITTRNNLLMFSYYDNTQGKMITAAYRWNGKAFGLVSDTAN